MNYNCNPPIVIIILFLSRIPCRYLIISCFIIARNELFSFYNVLSAEKNRYWFYYGMRCFFKPFFFSSFRLVCEQISYRKPCSDQKTTKELLYVLDFGSIVGALKRLLFFEVFLIIVKIREKTQRNRFSYSRHCMASTTIVTGLCSELYSAGNGLSSRTADG